MAEKWVLTSIVAAIVLLSAGSYVFYNSDYKYLIASMPDKDMFILKYDAGDKIEIVTRSSVCDYALFRITKNDMTAKCGYSNVATAKWYLEYLKTYGADEWIRLNRKSSGIELGVSQINEGFIVTRKTPYYATKSNTGDAGSLIETFRVTKDQIKSSVEFQTPYKTREWRAVYNLKPNTEILEDYDQYLKLKKNLNVDFSDALFDYRIDNDAFYKVQKGPFRIDPLLRFGNETGNLQVGSFAYGSCSECNNGNNVSFSSASTAFSAVYESGWILSTNIATIDNITMICTDNSGAGYCEVSVRNGTEIIPTNDTNTITRCLWNQSMSCHDGRDLAGAGNSSFPGAIANFNGILINESDAVYLGINDTIDDNRTNSAGSNWTINLSQGTIDIMVTFK